MTVQYFANSRCQGRGYDVCVLVMMTSWNGSCYGDHAYSSYGLMDNDVRTIGTVRTKSSFICLYWRSNRADTDKCLA